MAAQNSPVNLFIAYSREDKSYLTEFRKHLSPLKKGGIIKLWDDAAILPGTEWDTNIKKQLENSHVVLLLISPDFLNSDYINQVELPKALDRQKEGLATVIPVILRRCGWEYTELRELQALPEGGLPVSNWPNHDDAYYDILTGVKKVVDRIRATRLAQGAKFPHKDIPKVLLYETFIVEARKHKQNKEWKSAANIFERALPYYQEEFVPKLAELQQEIELCRKEVAFAKVLTKYEEAIENKAVETALESLNQLKALKDNSEVQQLWKQFESIFETEIREQLAAKRSEPSESSPTKQEPSKTPSSPPKSEPPKSSQAKEKKAPPAESRTTFNTYIRKGTRWFDHHAYHEAKESFSKALAIHQKAFSKSTGWIEQKIEHCQNQIDKIDATLKGGLKRIFENEMVGVSTLSGQLIAPVVYEYIGGFREGLAIVKGKSSFGYIDPLANMVIPLDYDDADSFSEGRAKVVKGGKIGFIDRTGKCVTKYKYDIADSFTGGIAAVVKDGRKSIIDRNGTAVSKHYFEAIFAFSQEKELRLVVKGGKKGIINNKGEMLTKFTYDEVFDFCEGYTVVEKNGKRGYIDRNGQSIAPVKFETAVDFSEGFAAVGYKKDNYGYINTSGQLICECEYDYADGFSEGLAIVGKNNKYGYINTKGEYLTDLEFDSAVGFAEGLAAVGKGGKGGYINTKGEVVVPLIYETAKAFSGSRGQVVRNGKHGYINHQGEEVIPCMYEGGTGFNEGLAGVLMNGKFGFIDTEGRVVIPFANYPEIKWFSEGYAAVKKPGFLGFGAKWGYIDRKGQEAFPFVYSSAENFKNGRAKVVYKGTELTIEKLVTEDSRQNKIWL